MTAARKKKKTKNKRSCLGQAFALLLAVGLAVGVIGGVAAGLVAADYRQFQSELVLEEGEVATLVIPRNTSWPGVVERVTESGLVGSHYYFDFWGRQNGLAERVRAGTILLEGPVTLEELAAALRQGGTADEVQITFPEGLTIFHMADRVEAAGLAERGDFLRLARDPERFDIEGEGVETLEGYLYPDTYRFSQGSSAQHIIERMVRRWRETSEPLFEEHQEAFQQLADEYELTRHDIVTLASLIERETGVTDERDLISRVFYNRLDLGMRLQTDPTCVYGENTYADIPTPAHCRDPLNRYSTYVITGLPPGPIANPGRASLEAALNPSDLEEAHEYLFFVARRDGSGSHYFSRTYDEHRRAIQRYLIGE